MRVHGVGIGLGGIGGVGRLQQLELALARFAELGFDLVEIDPTSFSLILNGELRRPQLADYVAVLRNFDLRYSMHGLMRLNLAYDPRHELCRNIMLCQIEIAREMEAKTLVYHSGLQALDDVRHGVRQSLLSDDELAEGARQEVEAFKALAPIAADAGVVICMENGDPHQWEYNALTKTKRPPAEISKHHPRLRMRPIVTQLEAIDHSNVGITLDVGHLYIAAQALGFDVLADVEEAASWVRHIHAHDNFGTLDRGFDSESDRWPYGEADVHTLPGWGTIPLQGIFARLPDYDGDVVLELKSGFWDYFGEGLAAMREILEETESRRH